MAKMRNTLISLTRASHAAADSISTAHRLQYKTSGSMSLQQSLLSSTTTQPLKVGMKFRPHPPNTILTSSWVHNIVSRYPSHIPKTDSCPRTNASAKEDGKPAVTEVNTGTAGKSWPVEAQRLERPATFLGGKWPATYDGVGKGK